jgi:glycosyltransferase involved in cell wall biosynthesis
MMHLKNYHFFMHILYITDTTEPQSGWGTFSKNTIAEAIARGDTVTVLTHGHAKTPLCPEQSLPAGTLQMLSSPIALLQTAWVIVKTIRKTRPDIIHILTEPYALTMPIVRLCTQTPPWVMNFHGTYSVLPFHKRWTRFFANRAWQQASAFLICSHFTKNRALDAARHFAPQAAQHIEDVGQLFTLGIEKKEATQEAHILFVGGVKPRKGVLEIVQACNAFRMESARPFHLHIVGGYNAQEPYIQLLLQFIKESAMDRMVTLHGKVPQSELDALYEQADLFMMLSKDAEVHFEGFGLVFLEASDRGIPVIGSLHSGCAEAIDEGKSGYAVDADDTVTIVERMRWILEEKTIDPEACQAWAASHSIAAQGNAQLQCYESVLATHPTE